MMEIHKSARKHGIGDDDIRHALRNALVVAEIDASGDVAKSLAIGPTIAGNLVEVVVIEGEVRQLVIHAMRLRRGTFAGIQWKGER